MRIRALLILITILTGGIMMKAEAATYVTIKTNYGDIKLELYEDKAPKTVENFLKYVEEGFYKQTIFHRVIKGFVIQGGGLDTNYNQKETNEPIENEAYNGLKNETGTIAMARTPDPHSATSQFYINLSNNNMLNFRGKTPQGYGYAVFGKVIQGMDIVEKIADVKTKNHKGLSDLPVENIVIEKVTVEFIGKGNNKK